MQSTENTAVIEAVQKASQQWQQAFNAGDAAGCAAQYESDAVMQAQPFGTFNGKAEIQAFWQQLIDDGFSQIEYIDPRITVVNDHSACLTAHWRMNNAEGVIHEELWVLQADGTAKLQRDKFEADKRTS